MGPLLCGQWKEFDFSLFSLLPGLPSACLFPSVFCSDCHSYKHLLITTDGERRAVYKECRRREQRGVLNKTSADFSLMGRQYAQKL